MTFQNAVIYVLNSKTVDNVQIFWKRYRKLWIYILDSEIKEAHHLFQG